MSHFTAGDWIDFTRGLLTPQESAEMRSHLDKGCEQCLKSVALWKAVRETLLEEGPCRVSDDVLARISAEYTAAKPWKWLAEAAHWAELVFDSFVDLQPVPVRGLSAVRQLIHGAEPFVIHLKMETDQIRSRLLLIGQILNSQTPDQPISNVQAVLLDADDLVVGRATASDSGEFDLQCKLASNLRLFIDIRGHRAIGIPLPPVGS